MRNESEEIMTYFQFQKKYSTPEQVIAYYISIRYPKGVRCNHCDSDKVYQRTKTPRLFDCESCKNTFSVFKNTIFEKSSTDLRKWMYAVHLFLNGKKGISGCQLEREIGVTYKTAWRILQQIRRAMGRDEIVTFETIVEVDETYVGGKPRKENKRGGGKPNKPGRGTKKTPVVAAIDRTKKRVYAKVARENYLGKKLTGKQLLEIIDAVCKKDVTVITDEFKPYDILTAKRSKRTHLKIVHSEQYADGFIHTNNVESFWATLKRGIYGIYHHVSVKYLQRYVNEFCFRYNYRNCDMFDILMEKTIATV